MSDHSVFVLFTHSLVNAHLLVQLLSNIIIASRIKEGRGYSTGLLIVDSGFACLC